MILIMQKQYIQSITTGKQQDNYKGEIYMFNNLKKSRETVIKEMTYQGKHFSEQEKFFKELWTSMRDSFTEENNTTSASFILERFLTVLPLEKISKDELINTIEAIYKEKGEKSKL